MKIDSCKDPTLLSALMDGELAPEQSAAVRRHMENCPRCRRQFDILRQTDALVQGMETLEPSADFDRTFWRKVADQQERPSSGAWLRSLWVGWRPALVAGVAAATAVVVISVAIRSHKGPTPDEVFMAQNMELLENFDMIDHLEMLEHLDAIGTMKEPS
jgi:anti-sigma factor RsiW